MPADYGTVMSFRLSQQEREKLNLLAQRTQRTAAQVLRLLIFQAVVADELDIQLEPRSDEQKPNQDQAQG